MGGDGNPEESSSPTYSLLWERIYARTCRMVLSLAKRYRVPQQEVEDLQHDAFYRIQLSLRRFDAARGEASLASWMYRHAQWEVVDHFRRRRRALPSVQAAVVGAEFPELEAPDRAPPDILGRKELERARRECIEGLPEHLRTRFHARLPREGGYRSPVEAARFLGLSMDTMRESLRRIKSLIKVCMKRKGFEIEPPLSPVPDGIEE